MSETLVLGLGNVLLGDDGLGVRAVEALRRDFEAPPSVRIVDGGTLGLALLGELAAARRLILIDAVASDDPPGTLVRLAGEEVEPAVRGRLSPHQIGVADLLDALRLLERWPERLSLLGLTPAALELGLELSPAVEAALPSLVDAVAAELAVLGSALVPRKPERVAASPPASDRARPDAPWPPA